MPKKFYMNERAGFPFFLQRFTKEIFDFTTTESVEVGDVLYDDVFVPQQNKFVHRNFKILEIIEQREAKGNYMPLNHPQWYRVKVSDPVVS
ncbi:hypothetical protein ACR777_20090 [Sphingobacterium spiritivorum]|uniref:hypothetical protein n=1 Tax=Sphingobacterium spiritivorum TaxID=258 RepID=UPI003DA38F76